MKQVKIYTDGACSGNPGPGGWGAILIYGPHEKELSGGASETTNNRMELTAVIEALKALKEPCEVTVYSDSAYVVNGMSAGWIEGWKKNGWKTSKNKPVENQDLWQELDHWTHTHKVHFKKVKGHSDDELNNRCDRLAVQASKRF